MAIILSPSSPPARDRDPPTEEGVTLRVSQPMSFESLSQSPAERARRAWQKPRGSQSPIETKKNKLIDPFLAQYMKQPQGNTHEIYFKSLKKQTTVKSFDYYQKYLKKILTAPTSSKEGTRSPSLTRVKSKVNTSSPLRQNFLPDVLMEDVQERDTDGHSELQSVLPTPDVSHTQDSTRRRVRAGTELPNPGSKKLHPQTEVETLSREFNECPTPTLVKLITRMLQSLINLNDKNVPAAVSVGTSENSEIPSPERKNKLLTRYHLRTPPAISIDTYISRLVKFNNFTQANLLSTIYYIDLLSHNFQPYFTLNSWTVHRFLLVATMLAQKALEDFFYTNDHYAKVGGVALTELNCLELDFLNRVDWKLIPAKQDANGKTSIKHSKEVLEMYYWQLVNLMGKNVTEQNNVVYLFPENKGDSSSHL